jgi:hypothetical protein
MPLGLAKRIGPVVGSVSTIVSELVHGVPVF